MSSGIFFGGMVNAAHDFITFTVTECRVASRNKNMVGGGTKPNY
jgi:hypothetical protein